MQKIFITYADERYIVSGKRLISQAKKSGLFDRVRLYTPKDLPLSILSSPAMAYTRGGGYWLWKPYVIQHAMYGTSPGDVVYYADAGCSINAKSQEWQEYDKLIKTYNALLFQYRADITYDWGKLNVNSPRVRHWIKPSAARYFTESFGSESYLDFNSLWSGLCIIKNIERDSNNLIHQWLSVSLFHPEILVNPYGGEAQTLPDDYNCHRHDQTILSALAYFLKDKERICILPETSESQPQTAAIVASRWRQGKLTGLNRLKYHLYRMIHNV